jgi:DHA1 family inner membrane transport protein
VSMRFALGAVVGLLVLGVAAFLVVPLGQTWLIGEVGSGAAGIAASVNISAAGLAGAAGAVLGGAVIGGPGLVWIGPVAAVPVTLGVVFAAGLRTLPRDRPSGRRSSSRASSDSVAATTAAATSPSGS